jgi:hypothetical protein
MTGYLWLMLRKALSGILLLIISYTNVTAQVDHWETVVYAEDTWRYFVGTSEPPATWNELNFDDSGWLTGPGSIGYGDGDDQTIISPTESLYMRRSFTLVDRTVIEEIIFNADFDDGFVAYLNGTEIARANMDGSPPTYNSWATALREAEMYNGGTPAGYTLDPNSFAPLLVDGENVLAIQTHNYEGLVSSDMTTLYWLSLGIADQSANYGPTPEWFNAPVPSAPFTSYLPILTIDTYGMDIPNDPKINAELGIIWQGEGIENSSTDSPNEFLGSIAIEKRGQSSLWFPKTGYGFETRDVLGQDLDTAFLNFPAEEDWILHGPYSDKSLMRNVLAMEIANRMGQYASRTRFIELVINGSYEGVYVLMERIKRDKNRVDVATLNPEDLFGDELTGGYVIKIDKDQPDWYSQYAVVNAPDRYIGYQYVSPNRDKIQPAQASYIQQFMRDFEDALRNPNTSYKGKFYDEYMDLTSFADHFIISEITRNVDAYRLSTYMHKDKDSNGGLLKMGPVWDYNLGFGNADYCLGQSTAGWIYYEYCDSGNPFWWETLMARTEFWDMTKCRWDEFRAGPLSTEALFAFIDSKVLELQGAQERNFVRWPILDQYVWPNAVVTGSFAGEIAYLKQFLSARLNWMDNNIFGECVVTDLTENLTESVRVFPNPSSEVFQIVLPTSMNRVIKLEIVDMTGKVYQPQWTTDKTQISVDHRALGLKAGAYILRVFSAKGNMLNKRIMISRN